MLEDPSLPAPNEIWTQTDDSLAAPNVSIDVAIRIAKGLPVKLALHAKALENKFEQTCLQDKTDNQRSSSKKKVYRWS